MRTAFIICGIDSQLNRIKEIIESIHNLYSSYSYNIDIHLATFGNSLLPPQNNLTEYAQKQSMIHYESPRQDYFPVNKIKFHCSDFNAMFNISKFFYNMGYDEVYLLHNDMYILRDFLPIYRKRMKGQWSCVVPSLSRGEKDISTVRQWEKIGIPFRDYMEEPKEQMIKKAETYYPLILPICNIIWNKELIFKLYDKYKTEENLWDNIFKYIILPGDIGLHHLARNFFGYNCQVLPEPILSEIRQQHIYKESFFSYIGITKKVKFIHGNITSFLFKPHKEFYYKIFQKQRQGELFFKELYAYVAQIDFEELFQSYKEIYLDNF